MRRLSSILSAAALTVAVFGSTAHALVISESVGAVDNLAPAPVTQLKALEAGTGTTRSVVLTWVPSVDDAVTFANFGSGYYPRGGVDGYRVYRAAGATGQPVLLATLSSGVNTYTDATVERGQSYVYSVNPFDTANELLSLESYALAIRITQVASGQEASKTFAREFQEWFGDSLKKPASSPVSAWFGDVLVGLGMAPAADGFVAVVTIGADNLPGKVENEA